MTVPDDRIDDLRVRLDVIELAVTDVRRELDELRAPATPPVVVPRPVTPSTIVAAPERAAARLRAGGRRGGLGVAVNSVAPPRS